MSKPAIHAKSSAKRFGGDKEVYLKIHNMMDSSKSAVADNRHRVVLHSSFGIFLMEKMFGINFTQLEELKKKYNLTEECISDILKWKEDCIANGTEIQNSEGKYVQVRDIAEQHIAEDFAGKFIPTLQDYVESMPLEDWMQNGQGCPPSFKIIRQAKFKKAMHE